MNICSVQRIINLPVGITLTVILLCFQTQMNKRNQSIGQSDEASSLYISNSTVPFSPFKADQPTLLVILSYQRCGSSFFGDLFDKNPNVFFKFEPLDALYSALYGTTQGWNVPADITNYKNGSTRLLSSEELTDVSEFLRALLLCDIDSLPVESLTHRYLYNTFYQDDNSYTKCIKTEKVEELVNLCNSYLPISYCGIRFGEKSEERLKECNMMLNNITYRNQRTDIIHIFRDYLSCRKTLRRMIDDKCTVILKEQCNSRSLRAVKLVRGTMGSMELLLRTLPNFRLIHLIRDPRAVVLSRMKFDSSGQGFYSLSGINGSTMSREAMLYCNTVTRDIRVRMNLEKKYPGRIYPVIYEDVMMNIERYTTDLYHFVNSPSPLGTVWWQRRIGSLSGNKSISTATKWKRHLRLRDNYDIIRSCRNLFHFVQRVWTK